MVSQSAAPLTQDRVLARVLVRLVASRARKHSGIPQPGMHFDDFDTLTLGPNSPTTYSKLSVTGKAAVELAMAALAGDERLEGVTEDTMARWLALWHAHSVAIETPMMEVTGTGVYPYAAMVNHDCEPNSCLAFHGPILELRAMEPLTEGSPITREVTRLSAQPRHRRQQVIGERFGVNECGCRRCSEPLEESDVDQFMVAVLCQTVDCSGYALLPTGLVRPEDELVCPECDKVAADRQRVDALIKSIHAFDASDLARMATVCDEAMDLLHPLNSHLVFLLDQMQNAYLSQPGGPDIPHALHYCKLTLTAYEDLCPEYDCSMAFRYFVLAQLLLESDEADAVKASREALRKATNVMAVAQGESGVELVVSMCEDQGMLDAHERKQAADA